MAKIRFLVGNGSTQKLKRNVPKHLVPLAGKAAWVERIAHADSATAKQRASLFAVKTDAERNRLQGLYESGTGDPAALQTGLQLDHTRAQQIAIAYYEKRDRENTENGAYFLSPDRPGYDEMLEAVGEDLEAALHEASGEMRTTERRVVHVLVEHGVLSKQRPNRFPPRVGRRNWSSIGRSDICVG